MKHLYVLTLIAVFLAACRPSPGMVQTAIAGTQAAWTPTALYLPATSIPGITRQEWRVQPISGSAGLISEANIDPSYEASIAEKARGLDITPPFDYETYSLPSKVSFNNVADYYSSIMQTRGFDVAYSGFHEDKRIGLLIFKRSPMSIYVEFWDHPQGLDLNLVLVIYKNF